MSKTLFFAQNRRMGPPPQFSVQPTSLSFGYNSSSKQLTVNSNYPWTYVSGETSWCTIDTKSGDGADTINVSVTENTSSYQSRSATLLFRNEKGLEARVRVSQAVHESYTLSVSPSSVTLQKDSGSQATITISANQGWSISGVPSWARVSKNSGSGSDTVTITASSENTSTDERSATITVTGNVSGSDTVRIRQLATPIVWSVSPQSISLEADDTSEHTITVTSNTSWTISDYPEWVEVSKTSGSGNDTVTVNAKSEYTGDSQRSGTITFRNTHGQTKTVSISQNAMSITWDVNPKSLSLEATDTSDHAITVSSNLSWTISSYPDWMEVSKTSGTGNDTVNVRVKSEYTGDSQRSGEIVFKNAKDSTINVSVTQSAAEITYGDPVVTINYSRPESPDAPADGNAIALVISFTQTWGYNGSTTGGGSIEWATGDDPMGFDIEWFGGAGGWDGDYAYISGDSLGTTLKERTKIADVYCKVTINGKTGTSNTLEIYQEANRVESVSFDDTPWISYGFQGYENRSSITIQEGSLSFLGIIITSKWANTYTSGSTGEYDFLPEEATSTIQIPGSVDWAEISSQGGYQAGVTFDNNPGEARSCSIGATFSYKGSSKSYTINVTQEGAENYLNVSPQTLSFEGSGGTKEITIDTNESWTIS